MIEKTVSEKHIREMQHAIGLDYKKPKRGKYEAYRNYCCLENEDAIWEHLVNIGYAKCHTSENKNTISHKTYTYYLTEEGLNFMGVIMGCTITLRS